MTADSASLFHERRQMQITSSTAVRWSAKNNRPEASGDVIPQWYKLVKDGHNIGLTAKGKRYFHVKLTPAEVINCLLTIPSSEIAKAIVDARLEQREQEQLPELVKQLVVGITQLKS